eukprot:s877_g13.t1
MALPLRCVGQSCLGHDVSFIAVAPASEMVPGNEEYHGLPWPKQRLPLAPTDAAGWASRAFHASLSSEKALQEAEMKQLEAEKHAEIARASMQQAQAAMLQAKINSMADAVKAPSVKPYLTFCDQVAKRVRANPAEADGTAMVELRRFCAGLENYLDGVSRRPETVATRSGLRLYDVPPLEYPEEPWWMQTVPEFHVPKGLGQSPGALASALSKVRQLSMVHLLWFPAAQRLLTSGRRRDRLSAFI